MSQPEQPAAARDFCPAPKPPAPSIRQFRIELTPEGEQYVIPGCERDDPRTGVKQASLF